jgi:VanZ family protein
VYLCCIVVLSLLPPQKLPHIHLFPGADKVIHFFMYFIFSGLACWSLKVELNRKRIWIVIPIAIAWGVVMEIVQMEMKSGRAFSFYDIIANSIGVIVGMLVYTGLIISFNKNK